MQVPAVALPDRPRHDGRLPDDDFLGGGVDEALDEADWEAGAGEDGYLDGKRGG